MRSSRGHVRIERGPQWVQWAAWIGVGGLVLVALIAWVIPALFSSDDDGESPSGNRTWLEFAWTTTPVDSNAVRQLGARLQNNGIDWVYLEAAAWRSDASLIEGEHAASFAQALKDAYPEVKVLLWLRMSGQEIADDTRRTAVLGLARTAVQEWGFDGVQLNGRTVLNGSESFIDLVRALRDTIGSDALLSVTVPPDRVPSDPDVPIGSTAEPGLTWDLSYKQQVGLLLIDEAVIMAHAGGLNSVEDYEAWVAYQVDSYADAMAELDRPADLIVALPSYDTAPDHDPAVEDVRSAARGVKAGIKRAGRNGRLVKGVGLYEYKTTDSLEWSQFREAWLGQ